MVLVLFSIKADAPRPLNVVMPVAFGLDAIQGEMSSAAAMGAAATELADQAAPRFCCPSALDHAHITPSRPTGSRWGNLAP